MAIKIEKSFRVDAPIEQVWALLIDPESVVSLIPGASLDEVIDERNFKGRVSLKVGPVGAKYQGEARIEELDVANYRVRMVGHGMGDGSASMIMTSQLWPLEGGGTQGRVTTDVNVTGRLVQMGSRLLQLVSDQLFDQFVKRLQQQLQGPKE